MNGAKADDSFRVWNAKFEKAVGKDALPSVQMARNYFLKAVVECAPEILRNLSNEPFRLFRQTNLYYESNPLHVKEFFVSTILHKHFLENPNKELGDKLAYRSNRRIGLSRFAWTRYERPDWKEIEKPFRNPFLPIQPTLTERCPKIKRFVESLFNWSTEHNLDALWCREIAFETLDYWCSLPEAAPKINFNFAVPIPAPVSNNQTDGWFWSNSENKAVYHSAPEADGLNKFKGYETAYPAFGLRAGEEKEILESFAEKKPSVNRIEVREFLNQCERAARANGFVETARDHSDYHFKWLALYQCAGLSAHKIAAKFNQKQPTISGEIIELAKFCKIKLREPKRGRPKKTI